MWKKFVRDYLSFSRNQRRGLFILCGLILICKAAPLLFPYFAPAREQDSTAFKRSVAAFMALQHNATPDQDTLSSHKPARLFYFDPNTLPVKGWQQLGISHHTAVIIQHYREAGGHFYKKEDLKKIYGLPDKAYQRLAPYIHIKQPEKESLQPPSKSSSSTLTAKEPAAPLPAPKHKKPFLIDINKADSAAWCRLYGIGPVLSARIIRFKKALGGFYKIAQIAEVYGLADSTFQHIKQHLNILKVSLKKLNINQASVDKLKSHPYISYRLAASIKAFREMHGVFDSLPELKELQLVDDQIYRKLVPYLSVK